MLFLMCVEEVGRMGATRKRKGKTKQKDCGSSQFHFHPRRCPADPIQRSICNAYNLPIEKNNQAVFFDHPPTPPASARPSSDRLRVCSLHAGIIPQCYESGSGSGSTSLISGAITYYRVPQDLYAPPFHRDRKAY